eukprot:363433-Chlamydomonas_euryale.AAC.24
MGSHCDLSSQPSRTRCVSRLPGLQIRGWTCVYNLDLRLAHARALRWLRPLPLFTALTTHQLP